MNVFDENDIGFEDYEKVVLIDYRDELQRKHAFITYMIHDGSRSVVLRNEATEKLFHTTLKQINQALNNIQKIINQYE